MLLHSDLNPILRSEECVYEASPFATPWYFCPIRLRNSLSGDLVYLIALTQLGTKVNYSLMVLPVPHIRVSRDNMIIKYNIIILHILHTPKCILRYAFRFMLLLYLHSAIYRVISLICDIHCVHKVRNKFI